MKRGVRRNAGFTVLELVLSLGILAFITTSILGGLHLSRRAWEIGRREDEKGEGEAVLRALSELLSKSVPAIALDEQKVARLVFVGRPSAMFLVALSEGETYRGGLILTEIGFVGAQSKTLGLWTRVFRAPTAWSTPRDSMRATKVLRDVIAFELSYYGSWDATSPPKWRNEWIGSGRLPALVSIRIAFVRDTRRHTAETTVALRQS